MRQTNEAKMMEGKRGKGREGKRETGSGADKRTD
jgi:hypothetical protein